jgi:hypothetical protein
MGLSDVVVDQELVDMVRLQLSEQPVSYVELADRLRAIPWDVLLACRRLVASGDAMGHEPDDRIPRFSARAGPWR